MSSNEHVILCGGATPTEIDAPNQLILDLQCRSRNVKLQISDISQRLLASIPEVLVDLLEIAAYVYAADSAIGRGGNTDVRMGARWRRQFHFVIPVRCPERWSSPSVYDALVETLSFLSDDSYSFEFVRLEAPIHVAEYFEFDATSETAFTPDEIVLFSGGLDSLSGAVDILANSERNVALVSHRSASKIAGAQKHLVRQLQSRFGTHRALHVPIWANLRQGNTREPTHRTRSFLFAALGAVTARLFNLDKIEFFENGIVSLNLPISPAVVGARATRTTHPQVTSGFQRIFSEVFGRAFNVENPFIWSTKFEIVERISANGCGDLIRHTRSCTRVHDMTRYQPHCGHCSQCIDRRFAVLAAGQEEQDPAEAYKVDLLTGERPEGPDREIALAYVRFASRVRRLDDIAFFAHYGEISRVVDCFDEQADTVAERILSLHRRHAAAVCGVLDEAISENASSLREGDLSPDCLLSLVVGQHGSAQAYPAPSNEPAQRAAIYSEIRIAIDQARKRVVFDKWGEIKGVSALLLTTLAEPFRVSVRNERAPEKYPFTSVRDLLRRSNCNHKEALRRRILRCRRQIEKLARDVGDAPPSAEAVIENQPWYGYRLNPDRVRIVALSDLRKTH